MAEQRCELTDLLVSQCGHCRPPAETPPADLVVGPWFTAKHPGRCSLGDDRIREGDRIRADGEGGYLCSEHGEMF